MFVRIRTLLTLLMLSSVICTDAQLQRRLSPVVADNIKTDTKEVEENWWGYFDGDYNSISVTGVGASNNLPQKYNCAIKIDADNPEVLGKRIKAFSFAFERLNYIDDVKIWMSTTMPDNAEDADIYCIPVEKESLKSFEADNDINKVYFPEPYQIRNEDIYLGYSFNVTSNEGDLCTFPIVVSYANTLQNAFFLDWGAGWFDMAGKNYGNLAVMVLLDNGGVFEMGDVNYDLDINVIDVTAVIEYILKGNLKPFNEKCADIDGNGSVNIVDVESIIDIILERYKAPDDNVAEESSDVLSAEKSVNGCALSLAAGDSYRGFQMDVILPEGNEISAVCADKTIEATHDIRYTKISDGRYRLMVNSVNGSDFSGNMSQFINIVTDTEDVKFENIIFATSELRERRFDNISMSDVTGIDEITNAEVTNDIYDIYGVKVNGNARNIAKGVYIVNGKKVIKK